MTKLHFSIAELYLPNDNETQLLIRQTRNLRTLQEEHKIHLDFSTINDHAKCAELLMEFTNRRRDKSLIEVGLVGVCPSHAHLLLV